MTTTEQRVGKLAAGDLGALAAFRAHAGWLLREEDGGVFWLRVPAEDEDEFRKLPLLGRWNLVDGGKIVREGHRVPEALLPADGWKPLAVFLPVMPPPRGGPGMPPVPVGFELVADDAGTPADALLCRWGAFVGWVETAFAPRLERLHYACSEDGRAFVCGDPLPAIPGGGFYRAGRLWLPCGQRLPDHAWPELLEEVLRLGRNRMAILHADGSHEELDEENLIPASRAAVRTTGHEHPVIS